MASWIAIYNLSITDRASRGYYVFYLIPSSSNKIILGLAPSFDEAYKVIEFEEGKNAIELPSKAELEPTLQRIKKAVDNGEFDTLLEQQLAYGSGLNRKRHNIRVV